MAENIQSKIKDSSGRIVQWVKKHPWVAGVILVGVGILAYIAYKNNASASGTAAADQTAASGGTDTGAAIPGAPISDVNLPVPPPIGGTISGGGGGGGGGRRGGGGGGGATALTSASLLQPATTITSPDLSNATINDYMWAAYQAGLTPTDMSVQPGQNIFENPQAAALINSIGGGAVVAGAQPSSVSGPALSDLLNPPTFSQISGGKTGGRSNTTTAQNSAAIAAGAADLVTQIQNAAAGAVNAINSFFGGTVPNATMAAGAAAAQAPNLAASLVNQINASINQAVGAQVLPGGKTAGVSATAQFPVSPSAAAYSSGPAGKTTPQPALPKRTYAVNAHMGTVGVGHNKVPALISTNPYTGQKNVKS